MKSAKQIKFERLIPPPKVFVSITDLFSMSDPRCSPGWTGNRCHVRAKPSLSTPTPEPEDTQMGNKETHLRSSCLTSICFLYPCTNVSAVHWSPLSLGELHPPPFCLDSVYTGIAIGLLLFVGGVAVYVLVACRRKVPLIVSCGYDHKLFVTDGWRVCTFSKN